MGKFIPRSPAHFCIVSGQTGKVWVYREIACGDWRSEDDTGEIIASVFLRPITNLLFSPSCSIREGRTWKTHGPKFTTVLLTGYRASLIHNSFWQYICSQYESTTYVVVLDGSDQQVLLYGNDGYAISYKGFTTLNADTPVWVVC